MKIIVVLALVGLAATIDAKTGRTKKRGVAYEDAAFTKLFGDSISWGYNWNSAQSGSPSADYSYVPMIHGHEIDTRGPDDMKNAIYAIERGASWVLSFNEPDKCGDGGSCIMNVSYAVELHKKYVAPLAEKGAKIVSPAVTNGQDYTGTIGISYLRKFMDECHNCQIDAVAVHYYAWDDPESFKAYMNEVYATFKKPIWITEFGVNPDEGDPISFLKKILPWLDNADIIDRYSYFYAARSTPERPLLVNAEGTGLSCLGQLYVSA